MTLPYYIAVAATLSFGQKISTTYWEENVLRHSSLHRTIKSQTGSGTAAPAKCRTRRGPAAHYYSPSTVRLNRAQWLGPARREANISGALTVWFAYNLFKLFFLASIFFLSTGTFTASGPSFLGAADAPPKTAEGAAC